MKQFYFLLLTLLFVFPVSSQITKDLLLQKWKISEVLGCSTSGIVIGEDYELKDIYKDPIEYRDTVIYESNYGNFLYLYPDSIFRSEFRSWCGIGVFPSSEGRYKFVDDNRIQFLLERVIIQDYVNDLGSSINLALNQVVGTYLIESTTKGYLLKFDLNDTINQQLIHYISILDTHTALVNEGETAQSDENFEWKYIDSHKEENTFSVNVSNFNKVLEKAFALDDAFDVSKVNILLIKKASRGVVFGILIDYEGGIYVVNYIQKSKFCPQEKKIYLKEAFAIVKVSDN